MLTSCTGVSARTAGGAYDDAVLRQKRVKRDARLVERGGSAEMQGNDLCQRRSGRFREGAYRKPFREVFLQCRCRDKTVVDDNPHQGRQVRDIAAEGRRDIYRDVDPVDVYSEIRGEHLFDGGLLEPLVPLVREPSGALQGSERGGAQRVQRRGRMALDRLAVIPVQAYILVNSAHRFRDFLP